MRILLQFPEGLKRIALKKAGELEGNGHEVFVSSSPCYGACDLAVEEAKRVKAGKIIHFGHSEYLKVEGGPEIVYEEYPLEVDWKPVLEKALKELEKFERIGLLTTVQHAKQLGEVKEFLEEKGKLVFVGKGSIAKHPGQVLGCDVNAAYSIEEKIDCFLFFGGGFFHPLAVDTRKPMLATDPFSNQAKWMGEELERWRKRRKGMLLKAASSQTFGIIVSTKTGQFDLEKALEIKKKLEKAGKKAVVLVSNETNFESLKNFNSFECFVNTACPRIWMDYERAEAPIINAVDLEPLLKQWLE